MKLINQELDISKILWDQSIKTRKYDCQISIKSMVSLLVYWKNKVNFLLKKAERKANINTVFYFKSN